MSARSKGKAMKKWDGVQVDSQLSIVARGRDDTQTYMDAWEELARRWDAHEVMLEALRGVAGWVDPKLDPLAGVALNKARAAIAAAEGK